MVTALDLEFLTATLGEKGIALVRPGNRFIAPAVARQVFDVSGAGDTVIAVLALCLASGLKPETAVELANVAAGIVVGKVGTVPVEKHELLAALAPQIALHAEDKVVSREELVRRVALWKANGERVVFTNGCFDLLHIGHITVLEQARRFGDRLIVAINSDASVRGLKGPNRPIVGERERARVLARAGRRGCGGGVRRGHADGADCGHAAGCAGEGRRLRRGHRGWSAARCCRGAGR